MVSVLLSLLTVSVFITSAVKLNLQEILYLNGKLESCIYPHVAIEKSRDSSLLIFSPVDVCMFS